MSIRTSFIGSALLAIALVSAPASFAQTTTAAPTPYGVFLTTPNPDVTVAPGKPLTLSLQLINDTEKPTRAEMSLDGLPKDWTYTLKGGEYEVGSAMVAPGATGALTLNLTPAKDAAKQAYDLKLTATYAGGKVDLPLVVTLADMPSTGIKLVSELPGLRGTKSTTFNYKFKLTNGTNADALFNLAADAPAGFATTFKHGYSGDKITGLPVKAGATEDITLEVKPNSSVIAGTYPIKVATLAGDETASATVALEVTGSADLRLSGPQQRLSGEAVAGKTTTFPFTLTSNGSADATNIKLTASSPSDWKVEFDPSTLPGLAAGTDETVNVAITPSEKAIAGDYMVTVRASADGVSESSQFRVTVSTSTLWGIVGIAIIALAVVVLALAVMRYGRR